MRTARVLLREDSGAVHQVAIVVGELSVLAQHERVLRKRQIAAEGGVCRSKGAIYIYIYVYIYIYICIYIYIYIYM